MKTIKDFWYAVTSPEYYRNFMNYKKRSLLFYVFLIMLIAGIFTMGVPMAKFMASGGFGRIIEEEIPNFRVDSENGFWCEKPVEIDEYNFLIKADPNVVKEDITDLNGQYGAYDYVIMIDQEQIYLNVPGMQEVSARFDEMPGFSFTKEDFMSYIPVMYVMIAWIFVLSFLMDYGYYFLVALIVSWMAGIIASFLKLRIGNVKLFKMAVYAGTLSTVLLFIQTVTGISVPNYSLFSYVISLGYMYFALRAYKESGIEELPPDHFGGREE